MVSGSGMRSAGRPPCMQASILVAKKAMRIRSSAVSKEMLLLARMIDGPTARELGLVSELLPNGPALHARAAELAQTVAGHAPITLKVTKEALRRLQARLGDENIDDLITLAYGSADFREGMAAFLGKRAPKWAGK